MDRVQIELTKKWLFYQGEQEEAWYKGFDDSSFREVMLPHDWSVEQPFSQNYSSGTGYLAGGIGWYRLHFKVPEAYRGMSIHVLFDGVYKNSQVWCNSYHLGKRPNGYVSFSYEIGSFLQFGDADNVLCVKVTHTDLADSRWFTGSGIYRKVSLIVQEPVHPAEYGISFQTPRIEETFREVEDAGQKQEEAVSGAKQWQAQIKIGVELEEVIGGKGDLTVEAGLYEEAGRETDREAGREVLLLKKTIHPGEKQVFLTGMLTQAHLWSLSDPYRYRLKVFFRKGEEARYLVDEEWVGIRSIHFDADRGFFLNGVSTRLKGVCVHHDGGALGAAMQKEVWQRRLTLLKACGCNAIRGSHNPHMPELYELCDAMGFLMIDEAFDEWENPKNKWHIGHNVYPPKHQGYYEDFPVWHEKDLRAMVRRDRNHPSVILWSIGNEIDYPNDPYCHPSFQAMTGNNDANKPERERSYDPNKPDAGRLAVLAKGLSTIVRKEDDSRPVTLAAAYPELSSRIGFLDSLDVVGYNYKEHLYEEDHRRFPDKPLLGSENSHSYEAWQAVTEHEYISGQFLWTGIDYLGEAHGWPIHGSAAGLLTTAGMPKPAYYRRKTFWQQEMAVYLATVPRTREMEWGALSESWNYQKGEEIRVECYVPLMAGGTVSLLLNGRRIGSAKVEEEAQAGNRGQAESQVQAGNQAQAESQMPAVRQAEENSAACSGSCGQFFDGAFVFYVPFEEGVLEAQYTPAESLSGKALENSAERTFVKTSLMTTGTPEQIQGRLWEAKKENSTEEWGWAEDESRQKELVIKASSGQNLVQLLLTQTDEKGKKVTWQERPIRVTVYGAGKLAGLDNGDLADNTPFSAPVRKTFRGELVAYIRRTGKGDIHVTWDFAE